MGLFDIVVELYEGVDLGGDGGGWVENDAAPDVAGWECGQIDACHNAEIVRGPFERLP